MTPSANEIAALVLKAARGAGVPLGVAEDLSAASAWFGPREMQALARALGRPDRLADLVDLVAALDAAQCGQGPLPDHPLARPLAHARDWSPDGTGNAPTASPGPRAVTPAVWARLERWAARTLVPASAASRAAGAGAGAIDND